MILSSKLLLDMPDTFHFSAIIYEMLKQYYHGKKWYNTKVDARSEELGFKFKKWRSALHSDLELMAKHKM